MLSFECIKNEKSVYFLLTSAIIGTSFSAVDCPLFNSILLHKLSIKKDNKKAETVHFPDFCLSAIFHNFP